MATTLNKAIRAKSQVALKVQLVRKATTKTRSLVKRKAENFKVRARTKAAMRSGFKPFSSRPRPPAAL